MRAGEGEQNKPLESIQTILTGNRDLYGGDLGDLYSRGKWAPRFHGILRLSIWMLASLNGPMTGDFRFLGEVLFQKCKKSFGHLELPPP